MNPNLTNYIMPTSLDMPEIEVDIVDNYDPTGPFGAKGVGEPTCVSTAAAILNAIHDAVGVRIHSLPATAEKVHAAIKAKQAAEQKQLSASTQVHKAGRTFSGPPDVQRKGKVRPPTKGERWLAIS
jgi:Mg-chelatase subunit ChlI